MLLAMCCVSLRGVADDEAISVRKRDCFAEFTLSEANVLAMTSDVGSTSCLLRHPRTQHLTGQCACVFAVLVEDRSIDDSILYPSGWHHESSSAAGQIIPHLAPFL